MSMKESDYDFLCTNDTRQIKLAIQGDAFFAAAIQSETAKKIDLSGGTKNVEGITLAYCLKLTRIIWPEDTGAIKRLAIHSADVLASLDISALTNLEELSIFNCAELETITGLGKTVKVVNAHGVNLKSLDLSQAKNLEKLNVLTLHPSFSVTAKNCGSLQFFALQGNKINSSIQQCPDLVSLLISSHRYPVEININSCPNLVDACISNSENSVISGLEECKKATLHDVVSQKTLELKKMAEAFIAPILQHKPGPEDMETVIQKYGTIRERNHACIIMISLLSSMEKTLTLELAKEDFRSKTTTETRSFQDDAVPIIFLPEVNLKIPEVALLSAKRFQSKEAEIIDWLQNPDSTSDQNNQNLLILNKRDLRNLAIFNLLKQIEQKRQLLTFMGKQYPHPLMKKIYADFPRRLLRRAAPLLFDSGLGTPSIPLPPLAAAPPIAAAPPLDANKKLSDATLQRMMTETLRQLDFRSAMQNAALHRHSNALSRFIATRNQLAKVNAKLNLASQGRVAAATKTMSPGKQRQPGTPLDALPKLTPTPAPGSELIPYNIIIKTPKKISQHLHAPRIGKPIDAPPSLIGQEGSAELKNISVDIGLEEQDLHHKRIGTPMGGLPLSNPPALIDAADRVTLAAQLLKYTTDALEAAPKMKLDATKISTQPALTDPADRAAAELTLVEFVWQYEDAEFNLPPPVLEQPFKLRRELQVAPGSAVSAVPVLIDAAEQLSALENLMFDIEYFSSTLTLMTQEAKARANPDDTVIQSAVLIIEKSIAAALTNLAFAKSTKDSTAKSDNLLTAAQELAHALKKLNEACNLSFNQHVEPSERARLIDLLTNISENYLDTHKAKDQSSSVFGTGYQAGISNVRMNMLKNLLEALKNNHPLPTGNFNATLAELQKDKLLKSALEPAVELLQKYLTSSPEPTKRK